jgi:hypothetical protein
VLKITDHTRNTIFYSGALLLAIGGAFAYWAIQRFDALPNYQRVGALLPIAVAAAMLHVDDYRNWPSATGPVRIKAVGALFVPVVLAIGVVLWWAFAPDARAQPIIQADAFGAA